MHQGSVLSPLFCTFVLEALSCKFKEGLPFELIYADDLAVQQVIRRGAGESHTLEGCTRGIRSQSKHSKKKVMKGRDGAGIVEKVGKDPCNVCRKGDG